MFGFGSAKKQEQALRASLSADKFAVEFGKTLDHFKIEPSNRPNKSAEFGEAEGAAMFVLEGALEAAESKIKAEADLEAAAVFGAVVCDYFGRNAGLSDAGVRELQSFVPGGAFPATASRVLGARAKSAFGEIVGKGILKRARMASKKKGNYIR